MRQTTLTPYNSAENITSNPAPAMAARRLFVLGLTCLLMLPTDMKYKPEGTQQSSRSSGSGGSGKSDAASDMELREAHMILNVKEGDSMEVIRRVSPIGIAAISE